MRLTFISFFIFLTSPFFAQTEVNTQITEAILYPNGSKITRTATVEIPQGNSEISFTDLYAYIDANSIQVNIGNANVKMVDFNFSVSFLNPPSTADEMQVINDSIKILDQEIVWVTNQKAVLTDEEALIKANSKLDAKREFSVSELEGLSDFYRKRILNIRKELMRLNQEQKKLNNELRKFKNQKNKGNQSGQASGGISVKLNSAVRTSTKVTLTYFTRTGSWEPIYDIRSSGLDAPLEFTYRAHVSQNTGIDWEDIQLLLSDAKPTVSNTMPFLETIYASTYGKGDRYVQVDTVVTFDPESYEEQIQVVRNEVDYSETMQTQTSTQFKVNLLQSVKGDGQAQKIIIKELKLPADFQYYSMPGKNNAAYLVAQVPEYGQYNLRPGSANLFFDNTYLGKSYIDNNITSDTLNLSLGIDYGVVVERDRKTFTAPKLIGGSVRQTIEFEIKIRNNKSEAITINVLDQVPVSTEKSIEIKLLEKDGATYESKTGELKWQLNIPANKTETIVFSYQLKHPKGVRVAGKW